MTVLIGSGWRQVQWMSHDYSLVGAGWDPDPKRIDPQTLATNLPSGRRAACMPRWYAFSRQPLPPFRGTRWTPALREPLERRPHDSGTRARSSAPVNAHRAVSDRRQEVMASRRAWQDALSACSRART